MGKRSTWELGCASTSPRGTRAPAAEHAAHAVERMKAHGILLSTDGPLHNVIKIKPPLAFSAADAERLVATLGMVLAEDAFHRGHRPPL